MKNKMFYIDKNETIEDILKQIKEFFEYDSGIVCDEKVAYFKEDTFNKLLDYITNLKEYKMIFDTFSKRPYAHRYLEEKKKELGNNKIIGLDSEMIYKDYYDLQEENEIQKEKIEHLLIDLRGESEYKQRIDKAIEYNKKNIKSKTLNNILNGDDK